MLELTLLQVVSLYRIVFKALPAEKGGMMFANLFGNACQHFGNIFNKNICLQPKKKKKKNPHLTSGSRQAANREMAPPDVLEIISK